MPSVLDLVPANERHVGFWVETDALTFADANPNVSTIQVLRKGTFRHPLYGKFTFNRNRFERFKTNFDARVRGIDLAVDYAHNSGGEAAGWIKSLHADDNGLFAVIEWTDEAREAIQSKKWRYISADFAEEWKNEETGKTFKDVLFGAALTNRPFLKDMLPVNLQEVFGEPDPSETEVNEDNTPQGGEMEEFLEQLRKTLGLGADVDQEGIITALAERLTEPEEESAEEEENNQLAESPLVRKLTEEVASLRSELTDQRVTTQLRDWSEGSTKFGLPPALDKQARSLLLSDGSGEFVKFVNELLKIGTVPLSEVGSTRKRADNSDNEPDDNETLATVDKGIRELMEQHDISYGDASSLYFADDNAAVSHADYLRALTEVDS